MRYLIRDLNDPNLRSQYVGERDGYGWSSRDGATRLPLVDAMLLMITVTEKAGFHLVLEPDQD